MIPNMDTFVSLNLDVSAVVHVDELGMKRFKMGSMLGSVSN